MSLIPYSLLSPPELPVEDVAWDMQQAGLERLESAGLQQYEVSAFAQAGLQSRHNLNYWRYGDFLGIGAGAHGKITQPANGVVNRYMKHRQPKRYMQSRQNGDWLIVQQVVKEQELVFEFFLNQLRLKQGVCIDDFSPRTGLARDVVEQRVQEAVKKGFLDHHDGRLKPTELGWRFVNDVQQIFLP